MSSDNAKLNLVTDQDAGEALREMGYEPEHVEGTKAEQAKALLEEAAKNLDEVYDRTEEGTDRHEAVDNAIWDLDIAMKQMWPTNGSKSIDLMDPMECVTDCFVRCREVAINGEHGAFSTELMYEATDNVYRAATLLWGSKFTAELESRRELKRRAAATFEDETDEDTDEEIAESILEVVAKVNMDEAKSRAKADAPTTLEEALDLLNEAADMANWLRTATEFMADGTEEAREAASIARERAMDVMVNTMAAYYYLNGGTFADRDPEQGEADGGMLEYIYKQLENINGMLNSAIKDGHVKCEPDEDGAYPWQHEVQSDLLCLMADVHGAISGGYIVTADEPDYAGADKMLAKALEEERELGMGSTDMGEVMALGGPAHSAAVSLAHMHATFEHVMGDPATDERDRRALNGITERARNMIAEIYALARNHHGTATAGNATTGGESLDETPYVEVGYGDGSSVRITGHFGPDTIADVARLATRTTAPTEEEEM